MSTEDKKNTPSKAEKEANQTIEMIKEWAQWILIVVLFIVIGWPLLVEFFGF